MQKIKTNLQYLTEHGCELMKNLDNVAIEKYSVDGAIDWYHHLFLENENDKLNAILYCPYCGEQLKR